MQHFYYLRRAKNFRQNIKYDIHTLLDPTKAVSREYMFEGRNEFLKKWN